MPYFSEFLQLIEISRKYVVKSHIIGSFQIEVALLKGHCHAIWQFYKKLEGVFASIEFQN